MSGGGPGWPGARRGGARPVVVVAAPSRSPQGVAAVLAVLAVPAAIGPGGPGAVFSGLGTRVGQGRFLPQPSVAARPSGQSRRLGLSGRPVEHARRGTAARRRVGWVSARWPIVSRGGSGAAAVLSRGGVGKGPSLALVSFLLGLRGAAGGRRVSARLTACLREGRVICLFCPGAELILLVLPGSL